MIFHPELTDIRPILPFTGAFQKAEAEWAATVIVDMLQSSPPFKWRTFTFVEFADHLRAELHAEKPKGFLNPFIDLAKGIDILIDRGWVARNGRELTCSAEFARRCFLSGWRLEFPLREFFRLLETIKRSR